MANGFIKGVKSELKKVVWPTRKQLINNQHLGEIDHGNLLQFLDSNE